MTGLPENICDEISKMPEFKYGVNKVTVELEDGQIFCNVHVAWAKEIVRVGDSDHIPFDPSQVVKVRNEV